MQPKGHPPKPRLPAALPRTFRFNETLGLDLFEIESPDSSRNVFCNMVCWGTLYQLCILVVDKTVETVSKCVAERWIQYFGPPLVIIADQGKELVGTTLFKEFTNANSILLHIIDVRAPWQNGRTERTVTSAKGFSRATSVSSSVFSLWRLRSMRLDASVTGPV